MRVIMCGLLKQLLESISALKTQLQAGLSIPLMDPAQRDACQSAASDNMVSRDGSRSIGKSSKCVDDRPGYLTSNGLGSLEIGASHDD